MPRLSPRVKVALPVSFESAAVCSQTLVMDIGMSGAFVKAKGALAPGKMVLDTPVVMHYSISDTKSRAKGKVVRCSNSGFAVTFCVDRDEKKKLWKFIANKLYSTNACPYCDEKFGAATKSCQKCGWNLAFESLEYFDYYEKTSLLRKISDRISDLKLDQLYRIEQCIEGKGFGAAEAAEREHEDDEEFVGTCNAMLEVFSLIRKVAPTDISVLILGESGTGKEMTAQAVHERSARKDKPFVAINCGAIPENLLESELFGHERGAFTGAYAGKKGKFEHADGGTIFLDEIGEMPLALQVKLLRFLQDRNVERVGSVSVKKVDVRVIAATNCDLGTSIAGGRFRKDLFYRLNEFTISLPAIRERENDKIILSKFYLDKFCKEKGIAKSFSSEAADAIMSYDWPGNVREIINKVRRAMVMGGGSSITPGDLDLECSGPGKTAGSLHLSHALAQLEKERIKEALNACNNNISTAAAFLGITRQTLHRHIKLHGIKKASEFLK